MEMTLEVSKFIQQEYMSRDSQEWVYDQLEDGMSLDQIKNKYYDAVEGNY